MEITDELFYSTGSLKTQMFASAARKHLVLYLPLLGYANLFVEVFLTKGLKCLKGTTVGHKGC